MKKLFVIATLCAFVAVAADDKAKSGEKKQAGMPIPKAGPETRDLRQFLGTWKTQDTMEKIEGLTPGGEGASIETCTPGPGGFSILMNVKATSGPMASYRAFGILTYNSEEKEYRMIWTDNMTLGAMIETGHKEGNDIVMSGKMTMGGKTYTMKDVISDRSATTFTVTSYADDGSGPKKTMTIKATKEEKPKDEKSTK